MTPFFSRNYDSEIFAFCARLGEQFDEAKLRNAFLSEDYVKEGSHARAAI